MIYENIDPVWIYLSIFFSIVSGILIIFLLAVQSWVLVKLLPEIKTVSKNSAIVKEIQNDPMSFLENHKKEPVQRGVFRNYAGLDNCIGRDDPNHIHDKSCFS